MKEEKKEIQIDSNENTKENRKSPQDSKINNEIKNKKNIFETNKSEQKRNEEKPKFIPKKLDKSILAIFMKKENKEEKPKFIPNKLSKNRIEISKCNGKNEGNPKITQQNFHIKEKEQKIKEDKIFIEEINLKNIEKELKRKRKA